MKRRTRKILGGTATVLALSMAMSSIGFAADSSHSKVGGDKLAIANVSDSLLIRSEASTSADVVGYVKGGAGVLVESLGSDWSKVTSGKVSGYVKTSLLAFDEKAEELKDVYGVYGAVAAWDDVKVFSNYKNTSSIIGTLNEGEGYEILGSSNYWIEVQLKDGNMAYVAAEDVKATLVVDTAVAVGDTDNTYYEKNTTESQKTVETVEETAAADVSESYSGEDTAADNTGYSEYTEYTSEADNTSYEEYTSDYDDTSYSEDYTEYNTEDESTEDTSYDTEYTEESYEEDSYAEEDADYEEDTYYEEDPSYGVVDDDGDDFEDDFGEEDYNDEADEATDVDYSDTSYTVDASDSDLDLLAAIIYCEAGNQSAEGKTAVGQVVMNRVASESFPNTISEVIYQSGQFTPAGSGQLASVIGSAPADCYDAAIAALNGEGSVPNALYFNGGSGSGTQIGDHQFY